VSDRPKKSSLPEKLATAFAVGAVLSFGLCSVSVFTGRGGDWGGRTATISRECFYVCVIGLVASLIWWRIGKRNGE
jgi:hypothetical protein